MNVLIHQGVAMMSFEQDRGVWSDARMFDVAKGVLVTARRCGLDEALTELVGTAERHHMKGVRRVAGPGRARCRGFRLRRPRCHRGRPRHLGTPVRQAIDTMNTTTDRRVAGSNAGPARRREFGRNADLKRPPTVGGFGGSAVLRFCGSAVLRQCSSWGVVDCVAVSSVDRDDRSSWPSAR